MTDIIISCARPDRAAAADLAEALRERGYPVTVAPGVLTGLNPLSKSNGKIAENQLLITLWTRHAINSDRIVAKAIDAQWNEQHLGVLLADDIELPLSFEQTSSIEMTGNRSESFELDQLCARLGAPTAPPVIRTAKAEAAPVTPDRKIAETNAEAAIWYKITQQDRITGYKFYLSQYGEKGAFSDLAQEKVKALTTGWIRFRQFMSSRLAQGLAAIALLFGGAMIYAATQKSASADSGAQYAAIEERASQLEADLAAANRSRVALIASMSGKVSREKYAEANERASSLELQLASVSGGSAPNLERDAIETATYTPSVNGIEVSAAQLEMTLPENSGSIVGISPTEFGGDEILPAAGTPWACEVDGGPGVRFGSTCWPRAVSKVSLAGFGTETATSLKPIALLRGLEELEVSDASITELGPIASMKTLRHLDISGTSVVNLDPIRSLTTLEALDLTGTKVEDLSPLAEMANLETFCPPDAACIENDAEKVQLYLDEHAR